MAERHHGYNMTTGYTADFFREMAPGWLDFCVRLKGVDRPGRDGAYRYLDLGCGQGFHLCLLAAANPSAEFVGIDFRPDHIANGQQLAKAGGLANVKFVEGDFLDLAAAWPSELGTFDYILLQGILSWVSPELRDAAFRSAANASAPEAVAVFGYNVPPGWLGAVPLQHVAHALNKSRDDDAALRDAISMFRRLRDGKAVLFDRLPQFGTHLEQLAAGSPNYLSHELLTDHWTPLWHSDVAFELDRLRFSFVGSATIADALLPDALAPEIRAVVTDQADDHLREDVQDIAIAQAFRRDIFCRSPSGKDGSGQIDDDTPLHLFNAPPVGAPISFRTAFGGLTVEYSAISDILGALADGPKPFADLMRLDNPRRLETRSMLLSMLHAHILVPGLAVHRSAASAQAFNAAVARAAAKGNFYRHIASTVLGSGLPVSEMELLFLDSWLSAHGNITPGKMAKDVTERLKSLGRQLQVRGAEVTPQQLQSHIEGLAPVFIERVLPQWRRFGALE